MNKIFERGWVNCAVGQSPDDEKRLQNEEILWRRGGGIGALGLAGWRSVGLRGFLEPNAENTCATRCSQTGVLASKSGPLSSASAPMSRTAGGLWSLNDVSRGCFWEAIWGRYSRQRALRE